MPRPIGTFATLAVASVLSLLAGSAAGAPTVAPVSDRVHRFHDPEKYQLFFPPSGAHAGGVMNWRYNDANRPAGISKDTTVSQIQGAMAQWSAVCRITFSYLGETATGFSTSDGINVIGWTATGLSAPTTGDTTVAFNGTNITDADIRLNAAYSATYSPSLTPTAVHEVGHALGLNHSDVSGVVMSGPPLTSYNGSSTLGSDDIAGCVSLYGAPGGGGPDTQAPTVPMGLTAAAVGTTQINLSWTASTDNVAVANYRVYQGGSLLGTVTSVGASVTGLSPGTMYSFTVSACDAAGNCSAQSAAASATTQSGDTQPPTVPTGLMATAVSTSQVNLSWTASTDNVGVANYRVYQGASLLGTVTSVGASVTGLAAGTLYSFTVSACDAAGNCSAQSTAATATTQTADAQPPTVPTGLTATPLSSSAIDLAWTASTDNVGVANYRVFQGGLLLGSVSSANATVTNLAAATAYTFTVSACDAAGNCSAQSAPASASTMSAAAPPSCPPPQPPAEQQTLSCPAGQIGSIVQSRTYSCVGTTWTAGLYQTVSNTCRTAGTEPNYQDLWWSPGENGWGLTITQHRDVLFIAFYIYDAAGQPVWVVMSSGQWDATHTTYSGDVYIPTSSWFGSYDGSRFIVGASKGTASLTFTSASTATLAYNINGLTGTKQIARLLFGPVNNAPIASYGDMWWAGQQENGWGLVLSQQYHNIFATWFTYDPAGQTTWFVMSGGSWTSANTYSGELYRTRGAPVLGSTYSQAAFVVTQVGTLTLTFSDPDHATMIYTVDGLTQSKPITRLGF